MRVHLSVVFAAGVVCTPVLWNAKRGLLGLLDGETTSEALTTEVAGNGIEPIIISLDDRPASSSELTYTTHHHQPTAAMASRTVSATSVSAGITQQSAGSKGGERDGGSSLAPRPTASFTTVSAENNEVSSTPPGELTQWKVIGISIICVTFVGVVIMAITFFDTWSAFVRDIIGCGGCRKGKDDGMRNGKEVLNLVPDWGRRTWEFKLANEDGHRYPTLASIDSMSKPQSQNEGTPVLDYAFHGQQALGRRPSAK